jgi:hypothetical protein
MLISEKTLIVNVFFEKKTTNFEVQYCRAEQVESSHFGGVEARTPMRDGFGSNGSYPYYGLNFQLGDQSN